MKNYKKTAEQQGFALLAALMIVVIFAVMGMTVAKKAKENEKISGSDMRHMSTFEAGEQSLRDVTNFLNKITVPIRAGNGSANRGVASNFMIDELDQVENLMEESFVWDRTQLEEAICGTGGCPNGINFADRMDEDIWQNDAIVSNFTKDDTKVEIDTNNHLGNITTYTFVEQLSDESSGLGAKYSGGRVASASSAIGGKKFYVITVKASGFPPNTAADKKTAVNARENVIIQTVFAKAN